MMVKVRLERLVLLMNDGYLLVMFDVHVLTKEDRRNYQKVRKFLKKNGYLMLQKSVYFKYIQELKSFEKEVLSINDVFPKNSNLKIFRFSKKQFCSLNELFNDSFNQMEIIEF